MASLLALLPAAASASPFLGQPDIHGDLVAFTSEGDLWVGNLRTRQAERLTRDEGVEGYAHFSPDGTRIAFTAEYDGTREVYVMPAAGGAPVRLTYTGVVGEALGWTPDGKNVLYRTVGPPNNVVFRTVPAEGGPSRALPIEYGAHASFSPSGELAFTRFARYNEPWFGYGGGLKNDIWVAKPGFAAFRRVYGARGSCESPVWADGRICFIQNDGGAFSVMSVREDGQDPRRVAGPYPVEIRDLGSDGKRLVYDKGAGLEVADVATGKTADATFALASDFLHTRPFRTPASEIVFSYSPSPGGKRALAESRGQIVSLPVDGKGEARVVLARPGVRFRQPEVSPDGTRMAYVSDESGEPQIYVSDKDGDSPRRLTSGTGRQINRIRWSPDGKYLLFTDSDRHLCLVPGDGSGAEKAIATGSGRDGPDFDVSPDSKWIAYAFVDWSNLIGSVYLYSVETGRTTRVSDGMSSDFAPAFTKDGTALAFLSNRTFAPRPDDLTSGIDFLDTTKPYLWLLRNDAPSPFAPEDDEAPKPAPLPFRIDLDGLSDRVVEVPCPPGRMDGLEASGSGLFWIDDQPGGPRLEGFDLKGKSFAVMAAADSFRLSPDGRSLLFSLGVRAQTVPAEVHAVGPNEGLVGFGDLQIRVDPVAEWRQMFWEGWRYVRDYFYVPNMHGLDWRKVGEKYAAMLPSVRSRGELDRLFRGMLAELNVSHARTSPGIVHGLKPAAAPAFLGVDLAVQPDGSVRVARILRGDGVQPSIRSPLAEPGLGVKEGDYLLEVAGSPVRGDQSYEEALVGRAGQEVSILVNDRPAREGARRVTIRPMANEFRLRYLDWARQKRQAVERLSGGKIGYVHVLSMTNDDMADFLRQYLPQRNRQALIVDVRFNTGGYISNQIAAYLRQRVVSYFNQRGNPLPTSRQVEHFDGPMVCLINEFSKSNGEEFPFQFRAEGLGKLIGRRTWGGEVGSDPGWPLEDGGKIWVPNYGAWTPKDGWIIEGRGVEPDVDVDSDPNAFAQGRDLQLERAVRELLSELAKNPAPGVKTPPDPVRRRDLPAPAFQEGRSEAGPAVAANGIP